MNDPGRKRKLPEGWRWVRLGEVCEIVTGTTPRKDDNRFYGGDIPWIKPDDLDKTKYVNSSDEYLNELGSQVARVLPPGAVLVSCIGKLGKCAVAARPLATNQQINSLVPTEAVNTDYLYYACKTLHPQLVAIASTTIVPIVNKSSFATLRIPLPPLPEQRRIAAILTEQMTAVERARAAAEAQLKAAKGLPAAYLRNIFQSSSAKRWPRLLLQDVCKGNGQYGTSERANENPNGIPILRMGNITNGRISWDDIKYILMTETEKSKYLLALGDLLFNRTNSAELVGKTAIFDDSREAVFASYLIRFNIDPEIADPYYLSAYINSVYGRRYIEANMTRAIGQVNISATTMSKMPIPLPPLTDQKRIAETLREQTDNVDRLRGTLQNQLAAINALPAALLRRAFSGEL